MTGQHPTNPHPEQQPGGQPPDQWQQQQHQQWSPQWQGQQWQPQNPPAPPMTPPPPQQRNFFVRHKILTGLLSAFGLFLVIGVAGASGDGDENPAAAGDSSPSASSTAEDETEPQDAAAAEEGEAGAQESVESAESSGPAESSEADEAGGEAAAAPADDVAGLNTPVRDGKFEFTVTEVETGVATVGEEDFMEEQAQGQFVLVHLSVANIGDEAQTIIDSNQTLVDTEGRQHDAASAGMWLEDNDLWLSDVNPGNTVEGILVYDIPADATPASLELHDSMLSGGVSVDLG